MAKNPLFSTYRQGENRVTSSMLAVFERIDLSLLEELLQGASGESNLQMVTFWNQPPSKPGSVPDGRISGSFSYWFEVKTVPNSVRPVQLEGHLSNLELGPGERLFVITPDPEEPDAIADLERTDVIWFPFTALHEAIDRALSDPLRLVSEQSRFLLMELQALLIEDGLLDHDDTVIVAAGTGYEEYLAHSTYVCQPGRSFRKGLTNFGFYAGGSIRPELPRILYREDNVAFTTEEIERRAAGAAEDQRVADVINAFLSSGLRQEGEPHQVFLLSPPDGPDTVQRASPIQNDLKTAAGKTRAWTQQQRYVPLERLISDEVSTTSDLEA